MTARRLDRAGGFALLAAALPLGVLLVATWYYGAFATRLWAPVAVLTLTILAAAAFAGGLRVPERWARWAVGALWALAGWALLSAVWAKSPAAAVEGASRTALYAALFTVPCALIATGRAASRIAGFLAAGIGVIALVTLVLLVADGPDLFLAGRLDDPVGYRNATGCLFALGFWSFVGYAARYGLNPFVRAGALSGAALVLGLGFLTQARGVALALVAGGVVALALGPDRLRRAWAALAVVAGVAVASGDLLTPYRAFTDGVLVPRAADVSVAVDALLLLVVAIFVLGLLAALLDGGLRIEQRARAGIRQLLAGGLVVVAALALVGALAAVGNPVDFVDERSREFRDLDTVAKGDTRLGFAGGQRSDLWRIALLDLRDRPVTGAGEGSYRFTYYRERRSDRNLSDPHSLVFRLGGELGAVGLLCLLLFIGAVAGAVAVRWRTATATGRRDASALLAVGVVGLTQGAVDWLWSIPAVTGLSVLAIGLVIAALRPDAGDPSPGGGLQRLAVGGGLVLATLVVAFTYLGDVYIRDARAVDTDRPRERLEAAERAERLNPWSTEPLYLQAGALEAQGRRRAARQRLRAALDLEPANFVTIALLGDLELRAGRPRVARAHYRRALELNPLDEGLRTLARRGS